MNFSMRCRLIAWVSLMLFLIFSSCAFAKAPDCTSPDAWPAGMAFTYLKNAGIVDNATLDFSKTAVTRLASEKVDKDLYRQIHLIRFTKKSGEQVVVITVNDVSSDECSMSDVGVYVVTKQLGNYLNQK